MKKSVLWGSALLVMGLFASSCNTSTEPTEAPVIDDIDTSTGGNPGNPTNNTNQPGKVTITSSPAGSPVLDSTWVTMVSSNTGDTIVYTTSGVDPIASSDMYTRAFKITGTTTIKAAALRGGKLGAVATLSITIVSKLNKPSFSTSRVDTFDAPVDVEISPANVNTDTVYYVLSTAPGSPSRSSNRSTGTVKVTQSSFIVARSFSGANDPSDPETTQIVLKVGKLVPSVKSGSRSNVFNLLFNVTSKDSGKGATVRFTRNGSMPDCKTSEVQKNADSILVDSNQTITAIGCRDGWTSSDTAKVSYKFKVGSVSTTPDSGVHASLPQLKFVSATPGATFFYTKDSSLPAWNATTLAPSNSKTFKWTKDSAVIDIKASIWIRAVAVKSGWLNSDTMTARYVYIGDSALIDNFELSGLGSKYGEKGLSWFACQYQNGDGCDQDQKFLLERTLPRLDTTAPDYKPILGFRAWRAQVSIAKYGEGKHAGYAGVSVRVPEEYPGNSYRLVFWAKWQDTGSTNLTKLPLIVEMALKANSQNNGGYRDGYHRRVMTVTDKWQQFEVEIGDEMYPGWEGFAGDQPDSTDTDPKAPAVFFLNPGMASFGLTPYQRITYNEFKPSWTFGVSKYDGFSKGDITAFRFSIMQPMDSAVALTVGRRPDYDSLWYNRWGRYSWWKNPSEPELTTTQLNALVKNIKGYLWIDNVRLVRKSVL